MYVPPNNPNMQALYRAQIAGIVLAPANRTEEGYIRLKTNPRNLYLYLALGIFMLLSPLSYIFLLEQTSMLFIVLSFIPAALLLGFAVATFFKQKVILVGEEHISVKRPLVKKRVYSYDRIVEMRCFPQANVSGRYHGTVPLQNVMELVFDDKRVLKLPVLMPGYADLFEMIASKTFFETEISKVVQYYYRLGIDIRNKRVVQENIFPGMGDGGAPGGDPTNPFEGF